MKGQHLIRSRPGVCLTGTLKRAADSRQPIGALDLHVATATLCGISIQGELVAFCLSSFPGTDSRSHTNMLVQKSEFMASEFWLAQTKQERLSTSAAKKVNFSSYAFHKFGFSSWSAKCCKLWKSPYGRQTELAVHNITGFAQ